MTHFYPIVQCTGKGKVKIINFLPRYGCCPDGMTRAKGANFKGCDNATPCKDAKWGCCEDLMNPAHGPNNEGCCLNTEFGRCTLTYLLTRLSCQAAAQTTSPLLRVRTTRAAAASSQSLAVAPTTLRQPAEPTWKAAAASQQRTAAARTSSLRRLDQTSRLSSVY